MKPIEPGCLCLAYDPDLTHPQVCRAVIFRPKGSKVKFGGYRYGFDMDAWETDVILQYKTYIDTPFVEPRYLMRIDGGEETQKEREREKERVEA